MNKLQSYCTVICLFVMAANFQAHANDVSIGLFTDMQTFTPGGATPVLSVTAQNSGPMVFQDVHLGVISPDGMIYEFPDWNQSLQPWLPNFGIPANLDLPNTVITNLDSFPGGLTSGIWQAFFVLTDPGTLDINDIQLVGFNVVSADDSGSSYGIVSIGRTQTNSGLEVTAGGVFYQANTSFPDLIGQIQGQTPGIDQCVFNELFNDLSAIGAINIITLDAGQQSLNNGISTIQLDKKAESSFIIYEADPDPSLSYFDNGTSFTFTGTGGPGAGAFSVGVPTTKPFNLISPPPGVDLTINSSQNLVLTWENNNFGTGEVTADLAGAAIDFENPQNSKVYSINCRFVDDGEGVIPADLLSQLKQKLPDNPPFPIDIPLDIPIDIPDLGSKITLNIDRTNYRLFSTAAPTLTNGIAIVNSGAAIFASFE